MSTCGDLPRICKAPPGDEIGFFSNRKMGFWGVSPLVGHSKLVFEANDVAFEGWWSLLTSEVRQSTLHWCILFGEQRCSHSLFSKPDMILSTTRA